MVAFIEVLIIGTVRKRATVNRMLTATDSALMAAVIDAVLMELTSALSAELDTWRARGFRYLSPVEDYQSFGAALPAQRYQMLACSIDISDGAKQGQVFLAFPEWSVPSEFAPSLPDTEAHNMVEIWLDVPAKLTVELTHILLPFEAADKIHCGDLLPLPILVMNHVKVPSQASKFLSFSISVTGAGTARRTAGSQCSTGSASDNA